LMRLAPCSAAHGILAFSSWDGICGSNSPWCRRRTALADAELCSALNEFVSDNHLEALVATLMSAESTTDAETSVADEVKNWCIENAAEFFAAQDDDYRRRVDKDMMKEYGLELGLSEEEPEGESEYLDAIIEDMPRFERRREGMEEELSVPETDLPPSMWRQCVGYAYATMRLIEQKGSTGAHGAADFIVNNRGSSEEKVQGCGAIVNSVNAALEGGEIQGLAVIPRDDDSEEGGATVVAVTDPAIGLSLGLTGIVATVAGVSQTVYSLFEICRSYQALVAIV